MPERASTYMNSKQVNEIANLSSSEMLLKSKFFRHGKKEISELKHYKKFHASGKTT